MLDSSLTATPPKQWGHFSRTPRDYNAASQGQQRRNGGAHHGKIGAVSSSIRFSTLDGIRGIAAIGVMLYHYTQHSHYPLLPSASAAVDLFFCLSGFVIAFSYQNRLESGMSIGDFLLRRLIRLYPFYLIGLAVGIFALIERSASGYTHLSRMPVFTASVLNTFYMPYLPLTHAGDIFPTNMPAWSLFFELVINAGFALWAVQKGKASSLVVVLLGAISLALYVVITHNECPGWGSTNFIGGFPRAVFGIFSGVYIFLFLS